MKYILYFAVLLFSAINLSFATEINGHIQSGVDYEDTYWISVTDAPNFSVTMTSSDLDLASVWLFEAPGGDLVEDVADPFWFDGFPSVFPGDITTNGMYYLAVTIFGVEPTLTNNIHDGWLTDAANEQDSGEYRVTITGATVPAPPAFWLVSVGLLMLLRKRSLVKT